MQDPTQDANIMTQTTRIRLWLIVAAFTIFTIGQITFHKLFFGYTSKAILDAYETIDMQLGFISNLAKSIFALCESLCFTIILYQIREFAVKDLALRLVFGFYFALSMAKLSEVFIGIYFSEKGFPIRVIYAIIVMWIALIEYNRYKNDRRGTNT